MSESSSSSYHIETDDGWAHSFPYRRQLRLLLLAALDEARAQHNLLGHLPRHPPGPAQRRLHALRHGPGPDARDCG